MGPQPCPFSPDHLETSRGERLVCCKDPPGDDAQWTLVATAPAVGRRERRYNLKHITAVHLGTVCTPPSAEPGSRAEYSRYRRGGDACMHGERGQERRSCCLPRRASCLYDAEYVRCACRLVPHRSRRHWLASTSPLAHTETHGFVLSHFPPDTDTWASLCQPQPL